MQYELTHQKGQVTIKFTVTKEEWEEEVQSVYKKTAKKFNIQGFRKGQAPKKMIERYYGETVFFDDAFDECARKSYSKALLENEDIMPVDSPKVDIDSFPQGEAPLVFSMVVTTRPEVTLGAYTGMKIEKVAYTVSKEDVDAELKRVQERASRKITVTDRPVQNGDTVGLDYSGTVDGVQFNGGTAEGQTLKIGSGSFIPGFEEQMVGMKTGEEKDLKVSFPADYHAEDLKGKEAVFHVKVNEITFEELPELNDEFARDRSKFDTLAEYTADIQARMEKENDKRAESETRNNLLNAVVENATVDIPECMVNEELEYMVEDMRMRLQYMYGGMKLEDYFKYTNSSVEDYKKERTEDAKRGVKTRLVMQEVIKKEKIEVTEQDVDDEIKKNMPEGREFDAYKEGIDNEQISRIKNEVLLNKLFAFLSNGNTLEEKPVGETAAKKASADKKSTVAKKTSADKTDTVAASAEAKSKQSTAAAKSAVSKAADVANKTTKE